MKKLILIIVLIIGAIAAYRFLIHDSPIPLSTQGRLTPSPQSGKQTSLVGPSVFVPYWTLTADTLVDDYKTLIYFGVTPGTSGLNTEDAGYKGLGSFSEKAAGKRTYLTIRMLDSKRNFAILENDALQHALIAESLQLAKEYDFDGIVLDLEVSALPFASVIEQISTFNKQFYQEAKKNELHYAVALYGDTFFRIRPFDVKSIGENSDEVMIMAYDFHKSRGNPGPNFPLGGKETYDYDYSRLIDQFSASVAKEKLTVIFGLFGYDWEVDSANNRISHGEALSYNQIEQQFLTDCIQLACKVNRDAVSSESYVTYKDSDGQSHTVWFEDLDSVAKKKEFLQTKGITSYSFWAYSYY